MVLVNIIQDSEYDQRLYAKRMLLYYIRSFTFTGHTRNPVLYIGIGNSSLHALMYVIQISPRGYPIVGTDTSEATINRPIPHSHLMEGITFKRFDIQEEITDNEKYCYLISFWCLRWMYNIRESAEKMRTLLDRNGAAIFIIESKSELYDVINTVAARNEEWARVLQPIIDNIPPFSTYTMKNIELAIGRQFNESECYYMARHEYCVIQYRNYEEYKEVLKQKYTFDSIIPEHKLEMFYYFLYRALKQLNCIHRDKTVSIQVIYSTFVVKPTSDLSPDAPTFVPQIPPFKASPKNNIIDLKGEPGDESPSRESNLKGFDPTPIPPKEMYSQIHYIQDIPEKMKEYEANTSDEQKRKDNERIRNIRDSLRRRRNLLPPREPVQEVLTRIDTPVSDSTQNSTNNTQNVNPNRVSNLLEKFENKIKENQPSLELPPRTEASASFQQPSTSTAPQRVRPSTISLPGSDATLQELFATRLQLIGLPYPPQPPMQRRPPL